MSYDREPVNASFIEGMDESVAYHEVNTILGAATTLINLLLLFVLCASPSLRKKSEVRTLSFARSKGMGVKESGTEFCQYFCVALYRMVIYYAKVFLFLKWLPG